MKSAADSPGRISLSAAGTLVFFIILWLWDFPKPMIDDLFYCGAGLNLAAGGDYSNPLAIRQQFPSHFFFMYPPVHPHALAGWLKVWGTNTAAMTGFQMLAYSVTALATITLLRRHRVPKWLEWLVPFGVTSAFLNIGLRPEPLAVALTMAGFAFGEGCGPGKIRAASGFLLMALGAASAPRIAPFAAVLFFLALYHACVDPSATGTRRWTCLWLALAAGIVAAMICLWMIDFRAAEFLKTFHVHASRVSGSKIELLRRFLMTLLGVTQLPVLLCLVVLVPLSLRAFANSLARLGIVIATTFLVVPLIGGLGHGSLWFAALSVLVLAGYLAKNASPRQQVVLQASLWLVFLLANSKTLIGACGEVSGKILADPGLEAGTALALRPSPEHPVLLDAWVARYLYRYQIPAGCIDWCNAAPFPGLLATDTALRPGDIYLLGPQSIDLLERKGYLNLPTPKWVPMGLKRWAYDQYPRRVYIVHAEDCNQPGASGPKADMPAHGLY